MYIYRKFHPLPSELETAEWPGGEVIILHVSFSLSALSFRHDAENPKCILEYSAMYYPEQLVTAGRRCKEVRYLSCKGTQGKVDWDLERSDITTTRKWYYFFSSFLLRHLHPANGQ
jgi:hypothetical protein